MSLIISKSIRFQADSGEFVVWASPASGSKANCNMPDIRPLILEAELSLEVQFSPQPHGQPEYVASPTLQTPPGPNTKLHGYVNPSSFIL